MSKRRDETREEYLGRWRARYANDLEFREQQRARRRAANMTPEEIERHRERNRVSTMTQDQRERKRERNRQRIMINGVRYGNREEAQQRFHWQG